jgi:ribosomal protein S18 acetylase RimI-like enzyme
MITIRKAKENDAIDIQQIFYNSFLKTYPNQALGILKEDIEEMYKDSFSDKKITEFKNKIKNVPESVKIFVACDGNKLCGLIMIVINEKFNQLQSIYLLPDYQGKGIGVLLWNTAKQYFDKNKKIIVQVATYNKSAIKFYEKLGFTDTDKRFTEERHRMPISKVLIPEMEMEIKNHVK